MNAIPEDIRETVDDLFDFYSLDTSLLAGAVREAIYAERKRCASILQCTPVDDILAEARVNIHHAIMGGE